MNATVVVVTEGFEAGLGPFTSDTMGCSSSACVSQWVTTHAYTGSHAAYLDDVGIAASYSFVSDALAIPVDATAATLTFWHLFDFEYNDNINANYDGGVLEVSSDGGTSWIDAGAHITLGGYNGTIAVGLGNPLAGRAAWVNTSVAGWAQVSVDIFSYRGGPGFLFRLRVGTDTSNRSAPGGWWIDDVQISYDAESCGRSWSAAAGYPSVASLSAATSLNGMLYVFGGHTDRAIANAYRYSPVDDLWTPIASLPEARSAASALTDGTYIYILGGGNSARATTQTLWRYDPSANSYVTLAPFTIATGRQAAALVDGTIYRIAGKTHLEIGASTDTVEAYTIASNSWAPAAKHPTLTSDLAALTLDGTIYTAGGLSAVGLGAKTYRYDPTAGAWDDGPIADLPGPIRSGSGASAFYSDTWIVLGDNGLLLGWNRQTNAWRNLDQMPERVNDAAAAVVGGAFYVIGGLSVSGATGAVQRYVEIACATPSPTATTPPGPTTTRPPGPSPTRTVPVSSRCIGDCDGDGRVAVADLVKGVNVALERQPLDVCSTFDGNEDGRVSVNELVAAVGFALSGCPTS